MATREGLVWLALGVAVLLAGWQRYGQRIRRWWKDHRRKVRRPWRLRAKSPQDCPGCRQGVTLRAVNRTPVQVVAPWCEVKGKGGPKKQVDTQGFACPNAQCVYHQQREATYHALVGMGCEGPRMPFRR